MRCLWPVDMYEYLLQESCCWMFTVVADISYYINEDFTVHASTPGSMSAARPTLDDRLQLVDVCDRPRITPIRPGVRQPRGR
jgi:hypothetical protein